MNLPCSNDLELAALLIHQFYNDQGRDNSSAIGIRSICAGSAEIWLKEGDTEQDQFFSNRVTRPVTDNP